MSVKMEILIWLIVMYAMVITGMVAQLTGNLEDAKYNNEYNINQCNTEIHSLKYEINSLNNEIRTLKLIIDNSK